MNRVLPMVLLLVGSALAASFGARNGAAHTDHRAALWQADTDPAALAAAPLPGPTQRLTDWLAVGGVGWGFGVVLIGAGALLARRQQAEASRGGAGGSARVDFVATTESILAALDGLIEDLADLPMDDTAPAARERIDALFDDTIGPLVEGRGQLVALHGLEPFAEYFGLFSGAERNLGRVWSALTDGHAEVARESLAISRAAFADALEAYARCDAEAARAR